MSAGWEEELGTRDGASSLGARAADWAAEKRASLRALCLLIRSLLPPQPTW